MIEVRNVSKWYATGDALREADFILETGQVCGLIGPNGSGKTTLLRILATLTPPSDGRALISGFDVVGHGSEVRRRIGYMPDVFGGDPELSVDAYLEFFARIWAIPPDQSFARIENILRLVALGHLRNTPISGLSLGSRQRLSIGRVLLHNPEVLLLDEPVSGLDPRARVEMRDLLRELGRMGKTVIISSHILNDLADLCRTFVILEKGRSVFVGTLEDLKRRVAGGRWVEVEVEGDQVGAREILRQKSWVEGVEQGRGRSLRVTLRDGGSPADIAAALVGNGLRLARLQDGEVDLEEAFIRITREADRAKDLDQRRLDGPH
jgi:ABC-2 type transport system ATP-binding protein